MALIEALCLVTASKETTDLNVRQLAALLLIHEAGRTDEGSVMNIQERLGIQKPSVTRTTQRLEKEGLVDRMKSKIDGRLVFFRLTEKGKRLMKKIMSNVEGEKVT